MTDWSLTPDLRPWAYELRSGDTLTKRQAQCVNEVNLHWMDLEIVPVPGEAILMAVQALPPKLSIVA